MERPTTGFRYLDDVPANSVIAMAHRGGALHPDLIGLENTAVAFRHAVGLGYRYLETDVHATRDGQLVAFHDDVLDRVTTGSGPIAETTAGELRSVLINGTEPVPLMAELLEEFGQARFNIDLKSDAAVPALADLLARTNAYDRVCVGAFSYPRIREFRTLTEGRVATSAAPAELVAFLAQPSGRLARRLTRGRVAALQIPHRRGPVPVVTRALVRRAHQAGARVHVWTVDDPAEMAELLDLGVDGLITDRTDLLGSLMASRGLGRDHA